MLASSSRNFSPPLSTVSSAHGSPSPVQVKKVVIEGRSKHDGASLKMYLKLSVAADNVLPGGSIPLFPEDNIRITQSKVHPLDERSVPYFYSSTEQPLLQKAAQALQLGPKSSRAYHTLFPVSSPPMDPTSSRRNRESTSTPPPNDERFTGYILVSGYSITLILPKEFPPRAQSVGVGTESEGDDGLIKDVSSWSARSARRPSSMTHKAYLHMMAALDVFVPYVTTPPKGPFLVSIPVPRCLDNHLKLRISTPVTNASTSTPRGSFNSTSSEDDMPGWDFLTDPPVSRKLDKPVRKSAYQQSADEHSDSPNGSSVPGTELILGAYQSTDVLHVRWAPPAGRRKGVAKTEDGMRRVGVERTLGKTRCEVMGRERHYVKLGIMYDGICTGLWHPGVATMLGMDIALDVKGRRVSWPEDGVAGWVVTGGNAFGGLHSEVPPGNISRKSSFESTVSSTFLPTLANRSIPPARGMASLLRAPLPNQNTPDYSFENSPGATPPASMPPSGSASAYLSHVTPGLETKLSKSDVSPGKPVTLKVNLLKLLPPTKNEFSFTVKGTILLDVEEEDFVPLPTFHVLGSDKEMIDTIVSSSMHGIEIRSHHPDGPTRTLGLGEEVRCEDSVGLVFRSRKSSAVPSPSATPAKHRTPSRVPLRANSPRIKVEEPSDASDTRSTSTQSANLPCVLTTVTPLPRSAQHTHCVRVNIPAYALDTDTIEFGLALPQHAALLSSSTSAIDVLYASYAGRYVHAEVLPRDTDMLSPSLSGFDAFRESQIVGEMQFWVIVHLEDVEADSGTVEIVYLVGDDEGRGSEIGRGKRKEEIGVDVLLPCFRLPVSRYEVEVDCPSSFDPHIKYSTLPNHHSTYANATKLTHYWLPAGFFPVLSLSLLPSSEGTYQGRRPSRTRRTVGTALKVIPQIVTLALLYLIVSMGSEVRQVRNTIDAAARALVNGVPYSDADWGDGADPAAKLRWWTQVQFVTTVSSDAAKATTVASWERETVRPATPTVNLEEATPVSEKRSPRTETRSDHAKAVLIPLPAVPFLSWKIPLPPEAKEIIVKGLTRAWYLFLKVWNYPLDPN